MTKLLASYYLMTFLCTDSSLTNCDIYKSQPMTDAQCEQAAINVGEVAKKLEVKETVLFYCTEDTSDLPIYGEPQWKEENY